MTKILKILLNFTFLMTTLACFSNSYFINDALTIEIEKDLFSQKEETLIYDYAISSNNAVRRTLKNRNPKNFNPIIIKLIDNPAMIGENISVSRNILKKIVVELQNFNEKDFEDNVNLREMILSIITYLRLSEDKDYPINYRMPFWLFLAYDGYILNNITSQKVIRRTRQMPGLKFLIANDLIDKYEIISDLTNSDLSKIEAQIYGDWSRFVLELVHNNDSKIEIIYNYLKEHYKKVTNDKDLFDKYIVKFIENNAYEFFMQMEKLRATKKKDGLELDDNKEEYVKNYLRFFASRMAFSYGNPYSSIMAKNELDKLSKITLKRLDEEGKLTEEDVVYNISDLPFLMRNRFDAELIKAQILFNLSVFRNSVSSLLSNDVTNLIVDIDGCKNSFVFGTNSYTIKNRLKTIYEAIESQKKIEDFMINAECNFLNVYQLYPLHLKVLRSYYDNMSTRQIDEFMQKTEEIYHGTF